MARRHLSSAAGFALLAAVAACVRPEPAAPPLTVTEKSLSPVGTPQPGQALVTFLSGTVLASTADAWAPVEIGDLIEEKRTLRVGAGSYCELQFGAMAAVRVEENTEVALGSVSIEDGRSRVAIGLADGAVLCKVQTPGVLESFRVATKSVVCSARVAGFLVDDRRDGPAIVAVRDGTVSVLPAGVDALVRRAVGPELRTFLAPVEGAARVLRGDEEVRVDAEWAGRAAADVAVLSQSIEEARAAGSSAAAVAAAITPLASAVVAAVGRALEAPRALSPATRAELQPIERMRLVDAAAPVRAPMAARAAAPRPHLVKVAIAANPPESQIRLGGTAIGRGSCAGLFPAGERLVFVVASEGYQDGTLRVTARQGSDAAYEVALQRTLQRSRGRPRGAVPADRR